MNTVEAIKKLTKNENLTSDEIKDVMTEILNGNAAPCAAASFLTALRMKGETIEEITSAVQVLKSFGARLNLQNKDCIDIVGTGGDGAGTFNISTTSAFVVASGGVKVAKHGNVAASSLSGSADVLKALGANIMLDTKQNEELLDKIGICFMFAPKFIPAMKNVGQIRRDIKIRTIFNCLGPLINPSCANFQLIGVYDKKLVLPCINVMKNLGLKAGMTLFGECGLDEASVVSKTYWAKLKDGEITSGEFVPEDFNLKTAKIEDLEGGAPEVNAEILKDIFRNKIKGAKKDVVVLNSALAFVVAGKTETIKEGIKLANDLIESGRAYEKLVQFVEGTNEYLG